MSAVRHPGLAEGIRFRCSDRHPETYISNDQLKTLPLAPAGFTSVNGTNTPLLPATSIVVVLPCILIFFLAQRHIVGGISFRGSK